MRSFGAAALIALAIITECFCAHSDRQRSRSGPVRSVPVAADVKKDVDYDCPEEFGYYPHPTDCTLYYVCVFGGALLESCTGGLMYSHELQTCDWPRNVGCDGTSAGGEELESVRVSEHRQRDPPRPPPRRTPPPPPPPPPRAQPNPIVTSRGQPRYSQQEYEKQQQLYAEVDDLPPVEEIESDRQQRVYRGQPATIGQVQKDRDGYAVQQISSGRNLNSNIIPASIPQNNGKIGSFSFGSQVNDRRAATVTPAPQSYSNNKRDMVTDSLHDRHLDVETNEINTNDVIEKQVIRKKRNVVGQDLVVNETSTIKTNETINRNDSGEEMEYVELDSDTEEDIPQDDTERGKRQIRYYLKNGYKTPVKSWAHVKPFKVFEFPQTSYHTIPQNNRYQQAFNNVNNNNHYDTRQPHSLGNSNQYSSANPFNSYQSDTYQPQNAYKQNQLHPSTQTVPHSPLNSATQIITKSPPISALNSNSFPTLAGGFFNNVPQHDSQNQRPFSAQQLPFSFPDSSQVSSTVVTGKPVPLYTSPRTEENQKNTKDFRNNFETHNFSGQKNQQQINNLKRPQSYDNKQPVSAEYNNNSSEEDEDSYEESEEEDDHYKHDFKPPYEFRHPSNRYKEIENPFANPNFDFDAYLSKLSNGQYSTANPNNLISMHSSGQPPRFNSLNSGTVSSTISYVGMSTPKPFTVPSATFQSGVNNRNPSQQQYEQLIHRPQPTRHSYVEQQSLNENVLAPTSAGLPVDAVRPKLKPPNFKDDRQLPISYSFSRPIINTTPAPNQENKPQLNYSVTQKPFMFYSSTGSPIILSTPKHNYIVKPENIIPLNQVSSVKPYLYSTMKPHNPYITFKQSTPKPLTTIANEHLSTLQQYWNNNPSTESSLAHSGFFKHSTPSSIPKLEHLFAGIIKSTSSPLKNYNAFESNSVSPVITTEKPKPKRRPIPKPSPEMNDYYYDDDEEYYYEPVVKPKYMPSTEVRPQRPPMAQNYKEYDSDEDDSEEVNTRHQPSRAPAQYNTYKPETATKNYNDVSIGTKGPLKHFNKNVNGKIPIPVLVDFGTPTPNTLIRPEVSNYKILHHMPRNKTMHIRKPVVDNGPNTDKPPKYLNQTTLRPYTVRHRLAKPTTEKNLSHNEDKQTRGRIRHPNIVAEMKLTTPRDSHNQETRFTKIKHDDKSNSLEPTESVSPVSYSASPRPKMLYNGTQNYSPDQFDPFYAVYDEDGELYKDTDYVQQYNTASLRPAVQQTYRGTPPPARRPVETYTPRPSPDDYDDELIQPQINNQNQYQTPIRHSTRGEGNELGYDHNPSSGRTTLYEATTLSTTPPTTTTTSTSTTTQRPTTAPYTEAMTPSRYTPRSSTDENPLPASSPKLSDETTSSKPTILPSVISFSSLAKPFEKTDNSHRLRETISTTEKVPTALRHFHVTNNNNKAELVRSRSNLNIKKNVSLTSGFSIRRNPNNTSNPYTLTVLTRPFDDYEKARNPTNENARQPSNFKNQTQADRYYYDSSSNSEDVSVEPLINSENIYDTSSENSPPRQDSISVISNEDDDIPVHVSSTSRSRLISRIRTTTVPSSISRRYHIHSDQNIFNQPIPSSVNNQDIIHSTENVVNTEKIVETSLVNVEAEDLSGYNSNNTLSDPLPDKTYIKSHHVSNDPAVSPFKTLDNLRNTYKTENIHDYSTTTTSTTTLRPTTRKISRQRNPTKLLRSKPSYYSYHLEDENTSDQTTEILNNRVKNVIRTFLNNFVTSPESQFAEEFTTTTTKKSVQHNDEKVVNIGYQKKILKHVDEKPLRANVNLLQIVTESPEGQFFTPSVGSSSFTDNESKVKDFSSTSRIMTTMSTTVAYAELPTTPVPTLSSTNDLRNIPSRDEYQSKFSSFITSKPVTEGSRKFQKMLDELPSTESINRAVDYNEKNVYSTESVVDNIKVTTEAQNFQLSDVEIDIASTTSTTRATTTVKVEPTTTTTKSISFPTRASRVNPAIKLAATNPGGGRRSYQSSTKCSSDNSLQANPKCNEIKYQRPTSTRGRGSAHYSTASGSDSQSQPAPNRGTPPTRSRPTLKPSTAVVTKTVETADIYLHPPTRPAPVYPQPTPDKTAAKCRKDVCQLPDCYCGGKDIPGDLPLDQVPQIVLLTFDDSVNDLNKGLYADLFEKGRVNPNGCPISATFYVSHEWTDYSQVQNLYSAGHEMASHTISHSFGEQFSQKKWYREVGGQREILAAYGGVKLEDVRGMRAPFLSVGGNKMFKMLYDANFTYDSSLPVYENRPPSWPYTLDYKLFHDCMIPPCPTKSYPGVWEVPMVMWQDLNGGRCSMGDACANPPEPENVYKMILKNFDRHYTTNRAPFGLFYHAAWFTQPHHKEGFIMFLDFINQMPDVWIVTNWQALQWVRDPTPINRLNNFQPFQCNYQDRPKKCNHPKVCNLWHKSGVRYMRTCQPCPEVYPWTGKSGIRSSRIDNDIGE